MPQSPLMAYARNSTLSALQHFCTTEYSKHKVHVQWFIFVFLQKINKTVSVHLGHRDDQAITWVNWIYWLAFRATVKATTRHKIFPNERNLQLGNSDSKQLLLNMYVSVLIFVVFFQHQIYNIQNSVPDAFVPDKCVHTIYVYSRTCRTIALLHKSSYTDRHATAEITCAVYTGKRWPSKKIPMPKYLCTKYSREQNRISSKLPLYSEVK